MAISTTNLIPLDFETLKASFKEYLKGQTIFKDVDFEASNINVLLDVLAYNTFHNSFYLNMVAGEMFLDTAQLFNSVASHAKMLNYVPRSNRSSKAVVQLKLYPNDPSSVESVLVPKGTSFTGRAGSSVYTFTTDKNSIIVNDLDKFESDDIAIYEGRYITETFVSKQNTRYILSNPSVDTTSISVVVTGADGIPVTFVRQETFLGLTSNNPVYFLQAAENNQYEILFGDGVFGKKVEYGSSIIIEYRVSSGELPNTAAIFDIDGSLSGISNIQTITMMAAVNGAVAETVDEIRFRAPLAFATQQRAVTANDYKTLILNQFPDISEVGVFGGQDLEPPRYGRVAISMISSGYDAVTELRKQDVYEFISQRCPATIEPLIINPEFTYAMIEIKAYYNPRTTSRTFTDIELSIRSAVRTFFEQQVSGFDRQVYYSRLLAAVDTSDTSIINNDLTLKIFKVLVPAEGSLTTTIDFGNAIYDGPSLAGPYHDIRDVTGISSTFFTYKDTRCIIEDDGNGKLQVSAELDGRHELVKSDIGSVNYDTGRVILDMHEITAYDGNGIRLIATTKSKDVQSTRNTVLLLKDPDLQINVLTV